MNDTLAQVRKALKHMTMDWAPSIWMDTGIPDLNCVIGHKTRGMPYGRILEMSGWESHGKTAITLSLCALAQRDNALIIWGDLENSWEDDWAKQRGMMKCPACKGSGWVEAKKDVWHYCKSCGTKHDCALCKGAGCNDCHGSGEEPGSGLDYERLIVVQPYVGQFEETDANTKRKKLSGSRLSTGAELLNEMERCASVASKKFDRMVLVVDSLASILTEGEDAAGIENVVNMRVGMDLPVFLGRLLRRWVGRAQVYNAAIILTNQLRSKPGVKWGSPLYTPGGNAPLFYSHVRVRVKKTGKMMDGKQVGITGIMQAIKNKTGGEQWAEVGFRLRFDGPLEFLPAKDVRKVGDDE
jgi:RecA/RadA recombinase